MESWGGRGCPLQARYEKLGKGRCILQAPYEKWEGGGVLHFRLDKKIRGEGGLSTSGLI